METTTNRSSLSQELQNRLISFDDQVTEYHQLQEDFVGMTKETARLNQTADALEAEAAAANASWKALAKEKKADQRKINTEIERGTKLKNEAEKFRRTAGIRGELHHELTIKMIDARRKLKVMAQMLNKSYRDECLQQLMGTEGFIEVLSKVYEITDKNEKKPSHTLIGQQDSEEYVNFVFVNTLMKHIKQHDNNQSSSNIVDIPKMVDGEVEKSGIELMRLKSNGVLNHG